MPDIRSDASQRERPRYSARAGYAESYLLITILAAVLGGVDVRERWMARLWLKRT